MYLAHIEKDQNREQSLESHCLHSATFAAQLGKSIGLEQACFFAGLYHDIGKSTSAFQEYLTDENSKHKRGEITHSTTGAQLISEFIHKTFIPTGKNFAAALSAQVLAMAIASHHGTLTDVLTPDGHFVYLDTMRKPEEKTRKQEAYANLSPEFLSITEDKQRMKQAIDEILLAAERIKGYSQNNKTEFFLGLGLLARLIYSCLLDADRQDTYEFMTDSKMPAAFMPWEECLSRLKAYLSNKPSGKAINLLRMEISEQCEAAGLSERSIYRLTLPCGSGKTLAGLRFAIKHAMEHKKERIIYVVPFITIIDQNVKVVAGILAQEGILLEHHSNISEDAISYTSEVLSQNWHSQIIFTTMVSFLDSIYGSGSKRARRMQALINAVVIFDEIQTVPIKCISLFNGAINFLTGICKTTAVLCTATQPTLEYPDHPLRGLPDSRIIRDEEKYFAGFKRNRAVDATIVGGHDIDMLKDFVVEQYERFSTVLVIVNTKRVALELYTALRSEIGNVHHLSTNMCAAHRMEVLGRIEPDKDEPVVCVSTPLIEAGVDISFNCVIRSVTGLDSIAQAAGRCNRECKPFSDNEDGHDYQVFIVNPKDENLDFLPEIKKGRDITVRMLNEMRADKSLYDGDIMSQKAIKQYFEYYYSNLKDEMDYYCKPLNTELYDLLSSNNTGRKAYQAIPDVNLNETVLIQSFKTANEYFSVIDSITTPVLVPFGSDGVKLIDDIQESYDLKEQYQLLRKAQRYSVNLFRYEFELFSKLQAIRLINDKLNIYALSDEYYDLYAGITTHRDMKNEIV